MIKSMHQKIFLVVKTMSFKLSTKEWLRSSWAVPSLSQKKCKKEGLRVEDLLQRRWGVILVVTDNWEGGCHPQIIP